MQMVQPLDDLFSRTSNTRVLRALFRLPEGMRVSTREIARRAGLAHPTVTGVMNGLSAVGVVEARRTPWATEYQLNRSHVSIPAMEALFRWETTVRDDLLAALRQEIRSRAPWVQAAYLFGSASRGDMDADSDIDVAVLCPVRRVPSTEAMVQELSDAIHDRFGNRVEVMIGSGSLKKLADPSSPGYRAWRAVALEGTRLFDGDANDA